MSNPVRKNDKFRHGVSGLMELFPRELYASYIVPALFLLCVGAFVVIMDWTYASDGFGFTTNKPSPRTYRALSPMTYLDVAVTDKLRDKAGDSVIGVVVRNLGAADRMKLRLEEFYCVINGEREDTDIFEDTFPDELVDAFGALPEDRRDHLLSSAALIGDVYFESSSSGDTPTERRDRWSILWAEINKLEIPLVEKNLVYQLLEEIMESRFKTDQRLTSLARDAEKKDIPLVERRMETGDVIVAQGEIVSPSIARSLKEQGYPEDKFPLVQTVIMLVFVAILPLWMDIMTYRDAHHSDASWGCVVFVVAVAWICEAVASRLAIDGGGVLATVTVSFLCMPRRLAFYTALVGTISGVFITAGLSAYVILSLLTLSFTAVTIAYYAFMKLGSLKSLCIKIFSIAILLGIVNEAVRALIELPVSESMSLSWLSGETWIRGGYFLLFDLTATFLAILVLFTIEGPIGAFTVLKARELSFPSSPLLHKLQTEAPGTYHHSLMIGALAQAVAKELRIDENLIRVGAYYHDIGKICRPRHFVENQADGENIHDTLSPTLSAVAIIAHVREGVLLANEFRLPKKVKQFITEHHGTTCVNYFYKKALAQGENVERSQFCYPGPRPQSRETALLMLMDSLEAAVRSESKRISKGADLQEIIEMVINVKVSEKQLDDADFTFKELELIKAASLRSLLSMYHTRTVKEIKEKGS